MTYKQLLEELQKLPQERLEDTVTIFDPDQQEFIGVNNSAIIDEKDEDTLDDGHFYLELKSYGY